MIRHERLKRERAHCEQNCEGHLVKAKNQLRSGAYGRKVGPDVHRVGDEKQEHENAHQRAG